MTGQQKKDGSKSYDKNTAIIIERTALLWCYDYMFRLCARSVSCKYVSKTFAKWISDAVL